jgi:hypothetical protein
MLAKRIGFDQQDRISFSNMILCLDHDSWTELSDAQLARVLDGIEGFLLVTYLLNHDDHGRVNVA